jgi:hypothetical protein
MRLVLGALGDPSPQRLDLLRLERLARVGRGHVLVRVVGRDASDELAGVGIAGGDHLSGAAEVFAPT